MCVLFPDLHYRRYKNNVGFVKQEYLRSASSGYVHLSLNKSDKGLNELDERLLTFVAGLGAWCGGLGLGGGEDAAGRRRRRAPAEVAGKAREKSAQLRAELLFEPLFVPRKDGGIFETPNSLRDQHVETVLHGEHQQRLQSLDLL